MSAWWTLLVDEAGTDMKAGVTKFFCGRIYHGREEFPSIEAARVHVRTLVGNDSRDYREVIDLPAGKYAYLVQENLTREQFLATSPH